ncbi:MAG: hypothetical protein MUF84_20610, partial [Anaerolineae bacterium]|nr:hypothetical protein [Anaerolineae bacterium]
NLASYGIMAIIDDAPMARSVALDVGRVHYNRWVYIGGTGPDIAAAYSNTPVRSTLKLGGAAWFVGAGGPMGRMHVQRAIQSTDRPGTIVCTDISDDRLDDLCTSFSAEAASMGIEFICLNPLNREVYAAAMARFQASGSRGEVPGSDDESSGFDDESSGFDDIVVLAPVPALIADAATYLAPGGVMNIFAGVARGRNAAIDLSGAYLKQTRIIGHSASTIENMTFMLEQAETGQLSPNRSVAAIGSLEAAWDGLQAVANTTFAGKIVIYPRLQPLPLIGIEDLKDVLPPVYARMRNGTEWTNEAEAELLRLMSK